MNITVAPTEFHTPASLSRPDRLKQPPQGEDALLPMRWLDPAATRERTVPPASAGAVNHEMDAQQRAFQGVQLCRRDGIAASQYYGWSKQLLEAGKRRVVAILFWRT